MKSNKKSSFFSKIIDIDIESVIGIIFFIILFSVIVLQVFSREIVYFSYHVLNISLPFNPPVWTEESARWAWVWMVFIMWGSLEKNDGHLKASFLGNYDSTKAMKILKLVLNFAYLALICFLFVRGVMQTIRGTQARPVSLPFSYSFLYVVLPLSSIFVFIRVLRKIVMGIKEIINIFSGKEQV